MIDVVEQWYEHPGPDYSRKYEVGQFYWAAVPYSFGSPHVPRVYADYVIQQFDLRKFRGEEKPSRELGIAADEILLATKHKLRPVIILAKGEAVAGDRGHNCYLVVPLYSLKHHVTDEYKRWATPEFILRAQAYQYGTVFYLPDDDRFGVEESLVRFQHICCFLEPLLIRPRPVMLSEEARQFLRWWLVYYLGEPLNKTLDVWREVAQEELPKKLAELGITTSH